METAEKKMITVKTVVDAPIEKVWESWTAPTHITQWCNASDDWHAPYAENDVTKDGKFKTTMAAKDNSMRFDFEGVYTNVEPHKKLEYTMADGRKAIVTFTREGNKTEVTESFEPEHMNAEELQRGGWQAILDNFKKYTEARP